MSFADFDTSADTPMHPKMVEVQECLMSQCAEFTDRTEDDHFTEEERKKAITCVTTCFNDIIMTPTLMTCRETCGPVGPNDEECLKECVTNEFSALVPEDQRADFESTMQNIGRTKSA